jgi:CII-binding regulator of phage lambda lysogenization HflD
MTGAFFLIAGSQLALMTQSNAQRASLLPQRTLGPLHQFQKFGDRRAGFRMGLEQLHIVLRILFALARRLLRHFMFSRMVVKSRSSTSNSLVKRTDVNVMIAVRGDRR